MPVAAARQAEVGAADPQPAVGGRVGQHRVAELAVGLLEGVALGQRPVRLADADGERVAQLLQLTEVEHPGRARGGDPVRNHDTAEARGDHPTELALEPADLPAQLGPRTRLAKQPIVLGRPLGYRGRPVDLRCPVEQIRHNQILSGPQGRCSNP